MGILDALLGRSKPARPDLDRLFALPGAAVTLQASESLASTGEAAVCFKPSVGRAFGATEEELSALLEAGPDGTGGSGRASTRLHGETDRFGYRWAVVRSDDANDLVTRTHFVNSTLESHGYGPQLLCSVFAFGPEAPALAAGDATGTSAPAQAPTPGRATTYLVYLYKRGTFYPFVPSGRDQRDNEAELRLKAVLDADLAVEKELDRWFPLWELPIG